MRTAVLLFACVAWLPMGCQRTQDALVLRQKTTAAGFKTQTSESNQYWTQTTMVADEANHRVIVDFVAETLTAVDKVNKTYRVLTFDELKAKMDATRRIMELDTAGLTPDVVEELERIGEPVGNRAAVVEVKPTGRREMIAGYDAEEYEVQATAMNGTVWVSHEVPLPLGEAEKKAYRKSMDGMQVPNMQFALTVLKLEAVPLRATLNNSVGKTGTQVQHEVLEVRREAVGNELFSVPDDYSLPGTQAEPPPQGPAAPAAPPAPAPLER